MFFQNIKEWGVFIKMITCHPNVFLIINTHQIVFLNLFKTFKKVVDQINKLLHGNLVSHMFHSLYETFRLPGIHSFLHVVRVAYSLIRMFEIFNSNLSGLLRGSFCSEGCKLTPLPPSPWLKIVNIMLETWILVT